MTQTIQLEDGRTLELRELGDPDGFPLMVPRAHGEWLAAHVPGCEARIDDSQGHLTLVEHLVPDVHAWLLSHS